MLFLDHLTVNILPAIVLKNPVDDVLIAADAAGRLVLPIVLVGDYDSDYHIADEGRIRGGADFSIVAVNGNYENLPLLRADGDTAQVGGTAAASAALSAAGSDVLVYHGRIDAAAVVPGRSVQMSLDAIDVPPFWYISIFDGAGNNHVQLDGPAAGNALYPLAGTPDLGIDGKPWGRIVATFPTSDPGIPGMLWNDGGTVKVS